MVAVTSHDDFLLELGEALGGQVALRPVDSVAAALEHLSGSRRLQLLMIDSRGSSDLRGEVDKVHARAPQVPIIVFAAAEAEKSTAGALRSSNVFAVLPIPVDRRKTAAIFEGALADAAEKRNAGRGAVAHAGAASHARGADLRAQSRAPLVPEPASLPTAPHAPAHEELEAPPPARTKPLLFGLAAAALLVLAIAGGAVWFFSTGKPAQAPAGVASTAGPSAAPLKGPAAASSPTTSPGVLPRAPSSSPGSSVAAAPGAAVEPLTAAAVPAAQGTLDELLEKARLAMRERRYTEPATNCALLYYRSALGVDPSNGEARDGMTRLAGLLGTRFDESVAAGHYDEAAEALAGLKVAAPQDSHLALRQGQLLKAEWAGALAADNTDRAAVILRQAEQSGALSSGELARWRLELARHQTDARGKHFADLLNERIREGKLLEPSGDSAQYYLQQLAQLAPQNPIAQHGARDFIAATLRKARDAALGGHSSDSDKWLAEARGAGMTAADLASYQHDVATARQRAATADSDRLAQLARTRIQDGHLTDPAEDSAIYYLNELKGSYGDSATVESIGRDFAARLLEQAARSARAGQLTEMSSELALAQHWGADPVLVQAVQQIATGRGTPMSGAAPATAPRLPPGFAPKRIRYQEPEYPQQALDEQISGSVEVGFTVDLEGRPRDVRVIASSPPRVFDRAALNAVSHWRYEPAIIDNVPTEVPWRLVIRFQAPQQ
ncbi:MAG TPA: TonB family protein [Steroidobacteraceae bacterium]|nr:TonB family protein [Steroidobacteraceae bacterium]